MLSTPLLGAGLNHYYLVSLAVFTDVGICKSNLDSG